MISRSENKVTAPSSKTNLTRKRWTAPKSIKYGWSRALYIVSHCVSGNLLPYILNILIRNFMFMRSLGHIHIRFNSLCSPFCGHPLGTVIFTYFKVLIVSKFKDWYQPYPNDPQIYNEKRVVAAFTRIAATRTPNNEERLVEMWGGWQNQCRFLFYDTICKYFGSLRYFGGVCKVVLMVAENVRTGKVYVLYIAPNWLRFAIKLEGKSWIVISTVREELLKLLGDCGGCSVLILLLVLLEDVYGCGLWAIYKKI